MIFITGATGSIGSELCQLLAAEKTEARAMCRKQEQLLRLKDMGHEAILANFDQPDSLQRAMQGCDKLFLLTAPDERHFERERTIIDIAIESGIKQIVRVSTGDANLSSRLAYARSHAEIDHYLRTRPVNWTILRPTGFMQNFIGSSFAISKGSLPHMMHEGQISYIDLRDIALVAKCVLTDEKHHRAIYYLTGAESLTVRAVAELLTAGLDKEVEASTITEAEMRKILSYSGMSAWHKDALIEQFIIGSNGCEIDVTEEVQRITGKLPRSFTQFVNDYKEQFLTPHH
ncbi:NAD(P)H-binding protein [Chryseolinea sp. T2]|uniref:NAD(P)H-binding protein n=1 Tax=Chryseolinea sp. T2 TaxID=3129255 RepID=UPI0030775A30